MDTPSKIRITPSDMSREMLQAWGEEGWRTTVALRARVAELEAENQILKNAESDLRAFAALCRDSAKKILGMP